MLWLPRQKYLGVLDNNKLTWNLQISSVLAKANKTLGFLYRHFGSSYICPDHGKLLNLTLVRSHLSYAGEVWAPQSCITDVKLYWKVCRDEQRVLF